MNFAAQFFKVIKVGRDTQRTLKKTVNQKKDKSEWAAKETGVKRVGQKDRADISS